MSIRLDSFISTLMPAVAPKTSKGRTKLRCGVQSRVRISTWFDTTEGPDPRGSKWARAGNCIYCKTGQLEERSILGMLDMLYRQKGMAMASSLYSSKKVSTSSARFLASANHLQKRALSAAAKPRISGDEDKSAVRFAVVTVLGALVYDHAPDVYLDPKLGWSGKMDSDYHYTATDFPALLKAVNEGLLPYKYTFTPDATFVTDHLSDTLSKLCDAIVLETS